MTSQKQRPTMTDSDSIRKSISYKMEKGEAVLLHIGRLGEDYQDFVHTTRVNKQLRFFENEFLERLTYCPWWTVPIVWIPVVCYLLSESSYGIMETTQYYLAGAACWPALEYALHRFVFHMDTNTYVWNTIHFLIHGNHHVSPNDYLRLVFPPAGAAIITAFISTPVMTLFGVDMGRLIMAGLITGYVTYDVVHYTLHSPRAFPLVAAALRELKIHHFQHHRAVDSAFGITTISIDTFLGTTEQLTKE